jgi:hypothetical protein
MVGFRVTDGRPTLMLARLLSTLFPSALAELPLLVMRSDVFSQVEIYVSYPALFPLPFPFPFPVFPDPVPVTEPKVEPRMEPRMSVG